MRISRSGDYIAQIWLIGGRVFEKLLSASGTDIINGPQGKILDALWQEEQAAAPDPDRLCNLSGKMLGAVFTPDWADPIWKNALRELGEGLGRFVYWMDAWDDLKEDRKKGRFNPLNRMAESEDPESFTLEVLEMFIGEAVSWFEALPLEKDLDLLRNVLYSGVWQRYYAMRNRREKEEKKA